MYYRQISIRKITKEGQYLYLHGYNTKGNDTVYTYDLTTGIMKNTRGRMMCSKPEILREWDSSLDTRYENDLFYWFCYGKLDILNNLASYYKVITECHIDTRHYDFYASPDRLDCNEGDIKIMPKGFLKFVTESPDGWKSNFTLRDYLWLFNYKNINNPSTKEMNLIAQWIYDEGINNYKTEYFHTIFPIINNDLKSGDDIFQLKNHISYLISRFVSIDAKVEALDFTKGCKKNEELCKAFYDTHMERLLIEAEKTICPIETLRYNGYIAIVPKGLKDLKDEGEQQHNCVGSFYNESITQKRNLIYFIRKEDSPSKSDVTCRFHLSSNKTVEARLAHNVSLDSRIPRQKTILEFIEIIDNTIRCCLESEEKEKGC